jgi:hypothetical protein
MWKRGIRMAKGKSTRKATEPAPVKEPLYELPPHDHPLVEHEHPLPPHEHPLVGHSHELPVHAHAHEHKDLRGQLRGAVRAVLAVFEAGKINSEQKKAIHAVRVILGDAHGPGCPHENAVYEQGDRLICQDCREDVTADA